MIQWQWLPNGGSGNRHRVNISMADEAPQTAEQRRREIIERITSDEALMSQYRASRASFERGEPAIPGEQVRAEAKARRQRA